MKGLGDIFRQAQQMKAKMAELQQELEAAEFLGSAGGGAVQVVVNGKHEVKKVVLKKEAVDPNDIETLQDLIQAAVNDATRQVNEKLKQEVGRMTGGLGLPGFF